MVCSGISERDGMNARQKLSALQGWMRENRIDAFLQPVGDEYLGEYVPPHAERLAWLTDFTGSAGQVAVTQEACTLFVDGRYTLQASMQADAALYAVVNSADTQTDAWLKKTLSAGAVVALDGRIYSVEAFERLEKSLKQAGITLRALDHNPIDMLWTERPPPSRTPAFAYPLELAGEESMAKRQRLAGQLQERKADAALIATPDSVNWLLNIRGRDLEFSAVLLCYALLFDNGEVSLFTDPAKISAGLKHILGEGVQVFSTDTLASTLKLLRGKKILLDPSVTPFALFQVLRDAGAEILRADDPCLLPKALKNTAELEAMRRVHVIDGAAVCRLLHWLDTHGMESISEMQVADQLLEFRARNKEFVSPSFATIAGSGPNGAIVHYRATEASNRRLQANEILLLDSGGQYLGGTTDITRTIIIGTPDAEMRERFTYVLKGHIALASAVFPEGTAGAQLDALARQFLWAKGLDFDHGTGHGVGAFLHVHEGPQRIGKRGGGVALKPGMIVSNEPGYYKEGAYGIRIENLVTVREAFLSEDGRRYFGFDTLTCVPIDRRLIASELLTPEEKSWLNAYHARVKAEISPLVEAEVKRWLEGACAAV